MGGGSGKCGMFSVFVRQWNNLLYRHDLGLGVYPPYPEAWAVAAVTSKPL